MQKLMEKIAAVRTSLVPVYLRMTDVECDRRFANTYSSDELLGMCIDPYHLMLNAYMFYHSMNLRHSA